MSGWGFPAITSGKAQTAMKLLPTKGPLAQSELERRDLSEFGGFFRQLNAHPQRDVATGTLSGATKSDQISQLFMLARMRAAQKKVTEAKLERERKEKEKKEDAIYSKLATEKPRQISPGTETSYIENCPFTPPAAEEPKKRSSKKKKRKRKRNSENGKSSSKKARKKKLLKTDPDLPDAPEYAFDFDADKILAKINRNINKFKPKTDGSTDSLDDDTKKLMKAVRNDKERRGRELDFLMDRTRHIPSHLREQAGIVKSKPKAAPGMTIPGITPTSTDAIPAMLNGPVPPPPPPPPESEYPPAVPGTCLSRTERTRIRNAMKKSKNLEQILKLEAILTDGIVPNEFESLLEAAEA